MCVCARVYSMCPWTHPVPNCASVRIFRAQEAVRELYREYKRLLDDGSIGDVVDSGDAAEEGTPSKEKSAKRRDMLAQKSADKKKEKELRKSKSAQLTDTLERNFAELKEDRADLKAARVEESGFRSEILKVENEKLALGQDILRSFQESNKIAQGMQEMFALLAGAGGRKRRSASISHDDEEEDE